MLDIIIITAICLVLTFCLYQEMRIYLRKKYTVTPKEMAAIKEEDISTLELIGESAYEEMNRRVSRLLKRHRNDDNASVNLTCGPDNAREAEELHHILPGEPVSLSLNYENGLRCVDVYSKGLRIGRLVLCDAETVISIMRRSRITGVYVSEQNCYGASDELALRLVIFHSPQRRHNYPSSADARSPYRIKFQGTGTVELYQN